MVGRSGDLIVVEGKVDGQMAEALAAAWGRLLAMPSAERADLGRRARDRVLANYSIDEISDRIWSL